MEKKLKQLESFMNKDLALDLSAFWAYDQSPSTDAEGLENLKAKAIKFDFVIDSRSGFRLTNALANCSDSKRIILWIDSPGGEVGGTLEAVDVLKNFKEKNKDTQIVAYIHMVATSAAYWFASFADKIYVNDVLKPVAKIGSVGVSTIRPDLTAYFKEEGIKHNAFVSSQNKLLFDPAFALSEEQKKDFQKKVDDIASLFFQDVAKNRGLSIEEVRGWDAKVFNGIEALEKKMVDGFIRIEDLMTEDNEDNNEKDTNTIEETDKIVKSRTYKLFANNMDDKEKELQAKIKAMTEDLAKAKEELAALKAEGKKMAEEKASIEASYNKAQEVLNSVLAEKRDAIQCAYQAFAGASLKESNKELFEAIEKESDLNILNMNLKKFQAYNSVAPVQSFTASAKASANLAQTQEALEEAYIARVYGTSQKEVK